MAKRKKTSDYFLGQTEILFTKQSKSAGENNSTSNPAKRVKGETAKDPVHTTDVPGEMTLEIITKAALHGDAEKQYMLGVMYMGGKGHELVGHVDRSEGLGWLRLAAFKRHPKAISELIKARQDVSIFDLDPKLHLPCIRAYRIDKIRVAEEAKYIILVDVGERAGWRTAYSVAHQYGVKMETVVYNNESYAEDEARRLQGLWGSGRR